MPDSVVFSGFVAKMTNDRLLPPRTDLLQLGVFFDLDPPTLVVCEMKMKMVDLVKCQQIDILFQHLDRLKMSRNIQHETPVFKPWFVCDFNARDNPFTVDLSLTFHRTWKQLPQRLKGIKQSGLRSIPDLYFLLVYVQTLSFPIRNLIVPRNDNRPGDGKIS